MKELAAFFKSIITVSGRKCKSPRDLTKLDINAVKRIQKKHEIWLDPKGKDGVKADFTNCSLPRFRFDTVDYVGVSFRGAHLCSVEFVGVDLTGADFRDADLRDAVFQDVEGLSSSQLAGSDVTGAKLGEEIQKFESLEIIKEAAKNARKLFLAMLLGCVYSIITIATTIDARLITNSVSSPLPIIGAEIPILGFYWAAPLLLISLYLYFHIYMQRIWEGVAKLPAIFPDGTQIDLKVYPWLLLGLVRKQYDRLREKRRPMYRLQVYLSVFLAWLAIQFTLLLFWLRFVPRHDWLGTGLHIILIGIAAWLGTLFYHIAVKTLRHEGSLGSDTDSMPKYQWLTGIGRGILISIALLLISMGAIAGIQPNNNNKGNPQTWIPRVLENVAFGAFADLEDVEVSTKPLNWTGLQVNEEEELAQVEGAQLDGLNLRYANAKGAFLIKADFSNANLEGAHFSNADLRYATLASALLVNTNLNSASLAKAILHYACLDSAELVGADLYSAELDSASLVKANLTDAHLDSASLVWAKLQHAYLYNASLKGAYLYKSNLDSADLELADLRGVYLPYASLVKANLTNAHLDSASLPLAKLNHAYLFRASLEGADLFESNLDSANLEFADLRGAYLPYASLVKADFTNARLDSADLSLANLRHAYLSPASLMGADLVDSKLDSADLSEASLSGADLSGAFLIGAGLYGARLDSAILSKADLSNAILTGADFRGADLRGAELSNIRNWRKIVSIRDANIWSVIDPPEGFLAWADSMGAVSVETDGEWEELKRQARSSEGL